MARVLVVVDDPTIRSLVGMAPEEVGYEVVQAASGSAALTALGPGTLHPDVILLDMRMPGMDGWEFASRYRAQAGPKAPIVVMTAAQDAAHRAAQIAADTFLSKPFDLGALYDCVARFTVAPCQA